jgi:hypothetical protein
MDFVADQEEPTSEAFEKAHDSWLTYYRETSKSANSNTFLLPRPQTLWFDEIARGFGRVVNLFPSTRYHVPDFRSWRVSLDDAWNADWYNVGADLYEALSKAKVELADDRSAKREGTFSTIKP